MGSALKLSKYPNLSAELTLLEGLGLPVEISLTYLETCEVSRYSKSKHTSLMELEWFQPLRLLTHNLDDHLDRRVPQHSRCTHLPLPAHLECLKIWGPAHRENELFRFQPSYLVRGYNCTFAVEVAGISKVYGIMFNQNYERGTCSVGFPNTKPFFVVLDIGQAWT